jgi:hypothetical protein
MLGRPVGYVKYQTWIYFLLLGLKYAEFFVLIRGSLGVFSLPMTNPQEARH